MLSPTQIAARRHSIGASEISAVLGLSPYKSAWDLWREKVGEIEPEQLDALPIDAGDFLEPALRQLYRHRTGLVMEQPGTLYHPVMAHLSATPDGLLADRSRGLEIKVVNPRMLLHWSGGPPEYVEAQARSCMLVTDARAWDVLMCCGTEIRIHTFERDAELEGWIIREAATFWQLVETRTPPNAIAAAERMEAARRKWPRPKSDEYIRDDSEVTVALVTEFADLKAETEKNKARMDTIRAALAERCKDAPGLRGEWGSFSWTLRTGSPAYKAIAEELAGGEVPEDLKNKHRGDSERVGAVYLKNIKRARKAA